MQAARHEVRSKSHNAAIAALTAISFLSILLSLFTLSGCAALTIPAIDPSGNRIFSSTPTQLTLPQLHGPNGRNLVPNSSFPTPPTPPNCLQGPAAPKSPGQTVAIRSSDDRGRCGQMLLTPTRLVAPVGGEVVLIAGVCGEDGYLVSGEPIEWMLAPDSVGEIIEVGDDMKGKRRSAWSKTVKPAVEKLDVDFARGRTSSEAGRITRGSMKPTDDLVLKKGQTWVSLTSPTAGVSRVTVLAPDSDVWDRRRQTATIYWIDASWQFPPCQTVPLGKDVDLVTLVKQNEGFSPAENWEVKYRILNFDERIATFPPTTGDGSGIDVRVNPDAKAITQIRNISGKPGTAIVSIEITNPKNNPEKMPQLTIARSQVMVSWSAPLLELKVSPISNTAAVGESVEYQIILSNSGDLAAENVSIKMDLRNPSLQAQYIDGFIPDKRVETGAIWDQGVVPARRTLVLPVRITPTVEADYQIEFSATALPNFGQTVPVMLNVVKPELALRFAPAPGMERVEVGQPVVFQIIAANNGRRTLSDVSLIIDSDSGLQHAQNGLNRVSLTLPSIPPGQSRPLDVQFVVRKAGELGARLVAQMNGRPLADTKAFVLGVEATPRPSNMVVQLKPRTGSTALTPNGETGIIEGIIQNRGQIPLTNIQMLVEYGPSFELLQASPGMVNNRQTRQLTWSNSVLPPGEQLVVEMLFRAISGSPPSAISLAARSDGGMNAKDELNFNATAGAGNQPPILPGAQPNSNILPTPGSGGGLNPTANGDPWSLSIIPIESQIGVGQQARYSISFTNNRSNPDQNVALAIRLPQGVQVVNLTYGDGGPVNSKRRDDGSILDVEPFQVLRPKDSILLILELKHDLPGERELEAFINSAADTQGTLRKARIVVRPNL